MDRTNFRTEDGREVCGGEWGAGETVRFWVRAGCVEGDSSGDVVKERIRITGRDYPCVHDHVQTRLALDLLAQ